MIIKEKQIASKIASSYRRVRIEIPIIEPLYLSKQFGYLADWLRTVPWQRSYKKTLRKLRAYEEKPTQTCWFELSYIINLARSWPSAVDERCLGVIKVTCFQVSEPFTGYRLFLVGLGCSLTEQKQCLAPAITRRNPLFSQGDGCSYYENTPELCLKYITLVNLKRLTFLSVTDFEN